jgi:YbbR domain-containing protein
MIPFLRDLFFHDFWLKLFSLALAILIWLTVAFAIKKENSPVVALSVPPAETAFSNLPVVVMSSAQDVRSIKVSPNQVEVTVQGEAKNLRGLQAKDIRVIVDLTDIEEAQGLKKRIEVSTPPGISMVRVIPSEVQIVFPPKQ